MTAQAPERFGPYVLLDRINVGGMAEVFRGKKLGVEGFERLVALKRILPSVSSDPDFIEMFVDEAKIAVQLQHANIAQTYDLGKVDEQYFIAMEYVSGVDLRTMWDRARQRKRLLPLVMSAYVVQKVCEGLDAAHRKTDDAGRPIGLVHRDISPHNVLCSFEGEVKVIDFGIAKVANKISKTHAGALKGKFGYMSPEQVRGIELDGRSDIFACGTVLHELLVGRRLFRGSSEFSVLEKVRKVDFRPPRELNQHLDPELERIVMKALAKDPNERYQHASEMAEDLARYQYGMDRPFGRTDLVRYMQQHFGSEMEAERERLERYRSFDLTDPAVEPTPEPAPTPTVSSVGRPPPARPSEVRVTAAPVEEAPREAALVPPAFTGPHPPAPLEAHPEGTAPWIQRSQSRIVPRSTGLPTWAAMLIGALAMVAFASVAALLWVLMQSGSVETRIEAVQPAVEPSSSER